jgi:folate-binding protein YgfZ
MEQAAFIDLSNRGRLCLIGKDRQAFINGQVTNNVKDLKPGKGCYAALANAKGKMTSDLNIFILEEEVLLDFEPGLTGKISDRLEKFIIADDVQLVDASTTFGLIHIVGSDPRFVVPALAGSTWEIKKDGDNYVATTPRLRVPGTDIFFPLTAENPVTALRNSGLRELTPEAFDTIRIEQGIPKFGVDMDENTLAPEALGDTAISYSKGCYIGQEVIARIRTYGQVAKALRGLRLDPAAPVPKHGDKIFHDGKEVGWITSAVFSPKLERPIALGYVRKECNQIGTILSVNDSRAEIVPVPFQK